MENEIGYVVAYFQTYRRPGGKVRVNATLPTPKKGVYTYRARTFDTVATMELLPELRKWIGEKGGTFVGAPEDFNVRDSRFFLWEDGSR